MGHFASLTFPQILFWQINFSLKQRLQLSNYQRLNWPRQILTFYTRFSHIFQTIVYISKFQYLGPSTCTIFFRVPNKPVWLRGPERNKVIPFSTTVDASPWIYKKKVSVTMFYIERSKIDLTKLQ